MNKADLIDVVASETGSTKVDAAKALDAFVDAVTGALAKGDSVSLVGFGTFSVRHKKSRIGRNPKTGIEVPITERNVVSFSSSNVLKSSFKS